MQIPPEYTILFYASDSDYESGWFVLILECNSIYYIIDYYDGPEIEHHSDPSFDPEIISEEEAIETMLRLADDEDEWEYQ